MMVTVIASLYNTNKLYYTLCIIYFIAPTAYHSARYGAGGGPIYLNEVGCYGNESSLLQCHHNGVGVHNCGHYEDASVSCINGMP